MNGPDEGDYSDAERKIRLQEKNRKAQQAFRSRQKVCASTSGKLPSTTCRAWDSVPTCSVHANYANPQRTRLQIGASWRTSSTRPCPGNKDTTREARRKVDARRHLHEASGWRRCGAPWAYHMSTRVDQREFCARVRMRGCDALTRRLTIVRAGCVPSESSREASRPPQQR